MSAYAVFVEGLDLGDSIAAISPAIVKAARAAVNATATFGRTRAAEEINRQIAFPSAYLTPSGGRLTVTKQATNDDLSAAISARTRPTSLARFVAGAPLVGKAGVTLQLKPGAAKFLPKAFLIKLKGGEGSDDGSANVGLAIRTNAQPSAAYKPVNIGPNLWLLYGPSVDQVFKGAEEGNSGVRDLIAPRLETYLADEFNRLLDIDL